MARLPSTILPGRAAAGCLGHSTFTPASHSLLASSSRASITAAASSTSPSPLAGATQVRHATLIKRPERPYTFTQLVQLSDGSTYTVRTTSPGAMYRSVKDTRNHARWQPSDRSLRNIEVDEAGKLALFRQRFGHGWDAAAEEADESMSAEERAEVEAKAKAHQEIDLTSLIGGYAEAAGMQSLSGQNAKDAAKAEKKSAKKGKK